MDIFFPIFQFGCFNASLILIFLNDFNGKLKKGPPDAVKKIFSTLLLLFLRAYQIEKCSESTGINLVLFLSSSFLSPMHKLLPPY